MLHAAAEPGDPGAMQAGELTFSHNEQEIRQALIDKEVITIDIDGRKTVVRPIVSPKQIIQEAKKTIEFIIKEAMQKAGVSGPPEVRFLESA